MDASRFTVVCAQKNLTRKGVGVTAVIALQNLCNNPLPARKLGRETRHHAPTDEAQLGRLIRAGLARYDPANERYVATLDGQSWLDELRQGIPAIRKMLATLSPH